MIINVEISNLLKSENFFVELSNIKPTMFMKEE